MHKIEKFLIWWIGYFPEGGVLYCTTGIFTPELYPLKIIIQKESNTSPSCSLKSTMKQKKEIKRYKVVTYATYELTSFFCYTII